MRPISLNAQTTQAEWDAIDPDEFYWDQVLGIVASIRPPLAVIFAIEALRDQQPRWVWMFGADTFVPGRDAAVLMNKA